MKKLTEHFMEPHEWWDRFDAECDERYRKAIAGKSCLDCASCRLSDRFPCGFCMECGEMVYGDDLPAENGCEGFVSRLVA